MALKDHLSKVQKHEPVSYTADVTFRVTADDPAFTLADAWNAAAQVKKEHPEQSVLIRVGAGEYRTGGLTVTKDMSGTESAPVIMVSERGEHGERAVLNGGITVKPEDFRPVPEEIRERLHGDAKDHVLCADLKAYGISPADLGGINATGGYPTARKYDNAWQGVACEVFFDHKRMTPARYPNEGFSRLDNVADVGDCYEFPPHTYFYDWNDRRNHRGGSYVLSYEDTERVASWKSTDGVWAFGYFYWDWADSSTPVTFDTEHRRMFPEYVSVYGARAGAEFYFFNVLDELDVPGEYYLDRKNAILYLYLMGDIRTARVEISLSERPAITVDGAEHLIFDGFSVCNIRESGIRITGNHITVRDFTVTNAAVDGIDVTGYDNLIDSCEVAYVGAKGVVMEGGDRTTLTPGGSTVLNCHIHHFAEIYRTYSGGIHLFGVGNRAAHNEIAFAPHTAIFYGGNDQLIEYNYLHDVVQHSKDAGAIYSGLDWAARGSVLRYNALERVGSDDMKPQGIYWDDGLSGQTAYGNVLVDIGEFGFQFGGGSYGKIMHNLIVDAGTSLQYDDRYRVGLLVNGITHDCVDNINGRCWRSLYAWPIHSPVWEEHYPELKTIREDFWNREAWDSPEFPVNPAHSVVSGNIIYQKNKTDNFIFDSVWQFSDVSDNPQYTYDDDVGFTDPEDGDFRLREDAPVLSVLPDFPPIPFDRIGRY